MNYEYGAAPISRLIDESIKRKRVASYFDNQSIVQNWLGKKG